MGAAVLRLAAIPGARSLVLELEEGKAWEARQHAKWRQLAEEREAEILKLRSLAQEVEEGKAWEAQQHAKWQRLAEERKAEILKLRSLVSELEEGKGVGRELETARSLLRRELTSTDRPDQLLARTREALRALGEVDAELERRADRPPHPGDLFVFSDTEDLEWAVIDASADGRYLLVVPADTDPQVGSADVKVSSQP